MKIWKYITAIAIALLLLSASFALLSCGAPTSTAASEEGQEDPPGLTEDELEQIKEAIEEEQIEVIDYDTALIDAELYGYVPSFLCTDTDNHIKIEVTNNCDFTWRAEGKNRVRIGYHYYGQDVDYTEYDKTARSPLPNNLEPGESATVDVLINDIENSGIYVVQIDLVLEGHFWFSSKEIPMIENRVFFGSCAENN